VQEQHRVVDLFCGCGGFSLGAHAAGLGPKAAFDVDPILTSSMSANFPKTKLVLSDLSDATGSDIRKVAGGRVDGIFGGPPCQAFSDIGHRRADDPRRSLLKHFFRLVAEVRPRFFVMENVRGLGYQDARPLLDRALNLLPSRYEILGPTILDAANFGAATRRPRLFVIGYDPSHCDAMSLTDLRTRPAATVRDAISDISSATCIGESVGFDVWRINRRTRPSSYAATLRNADHTFTGHQRTAHTKEVVARFKKIKQGGFEVVGRHPRLDWNGQCPTLRAGTGSDRGSFQSVRPIHPEEPRVITVREAARLQGFPDRFKFHPTVWHSFRMIGNSVSPAISKAIFSLIASKMGNNRRWNAAAE
jgi:DNA (cytosine-5)-methyltransferase 1